MKNGASDSLRQLYLNDYKAWKQKKDEFRNGRTIIDDIIKDYYALELRQIRYNNFFTKGFFILKLWITKKTNRIFKPLKK